MIFRLDPENNWLIIVERLSLFLFKLLNNFHKVKGGGKEIGDVYLNIFKE